MTKYILTIAFILVLIFNGCNDGVLNPSDTLDETIPIMEVYMDEEDYQNLMSNHVLSAEVGCKLFYENKDYLAQIQPQGAGSRLKDKWAYHIKLQNYNRIEDLPEFNLSAQVYDKTMLRTTLTTALYKEAGFLTFDNKHIFLKINNEDEGLYPIIERIEQEFFDRRSIPVFELYKLGFDSRFSFENDYNPEFFFKKEIPDNENFSTLKDFIYAVDTCSSDKVFESLGKYLDVEDYIAYHALTSLMNGFDAFTNNFLLYKSTFDAPFEVIPWDFDKSFYEEEIVGIAGENHIIEKIFENAEGLNLYKEKVNYFLNTIYTEENIFPIIDSTAAQIKSFYEIDPYLKNTYNFDNEIQNLKTFILNRISYFKTNIDSYEGFGN